MFEGVPKRLIRHKFHSLLVFCTSFVGFHMCSKAVLCISDSFKFPKRPVMPEVLVFCRAGGLGPGPTSTSGHTRMGEVGEGN